MADYDQRVQDGRRDDESKQPDPRLRSNPTLLEYYLSREWTASLRHATNDWNSSGHLTIGWERDEPSNPSVFGTRTHLRSVI